MRASGFQSSAASLSGLLLPPSVSLFWKYELGFPPLLLGHVVSLLRAITYLHLYIHAYTGTTERYLPGFVCSFSHLP